MYAGKITLAEYGRMLTIMSEGYKPCWCKCGKGPFRDDYGVLMHVIDFHGTVRRPGVCDSNTSVMLGMDNQLSALVQSTFAYFSTP